MERVKIVMLAALLTYTLFSHAAWRVVIDRNTTAAVATNAASQKLIEGKHNNRLDSVNAKQQRLMQYTTTMATIKELYQLSMQNIAGFGEESRYYAEMVSLSADIFKDIPVVLKQLGRSPGRNYILCLNEMTGLVAETEGLVHDFVDIVNNGKVRNPLSNARADGKNDGYNFLDRYERLTLANRIYSRLLEIHYKLEVMTMMCRYCNGWQDMLMAIDVETWASFFTAKNKVDRLIDDWKGLGV